MISRILTFFKNNKIYHYAQNLKYQSIIKKLKSKKKINIIFLANHISQWKYDSLLNIYKIKNRYLAKVIYVPNTIINNDYLDEYNFNRVEFKKIGIDLINPYNVKTKLWKNLNKFYLPDIVFYSRSLIKHKLKYKIFDFSNCLNVYVPYSIHTDNNGFLQCATFFHKLLWKQFLPFKENIAIAKKFYNSKNIFITDYLGCDIFKSKKNSNKVWKNKNNKKIIWAPHHTIEFSSKKNHFSTFLLFSEHMKKLTIKYKTSVDFCFKPHPILKKKLYSHQDWGIKKTNAYFNFWKNSKNTILSESMYQNLFIESNALILDSVSFMAEYLYLEKPYCFLVKKNYNYTSSLNIIGKKIFKTLDKSNNIDTLTTFINNSVLKNKDLKKNKRISVLQGINCLNKKNTLAANNIFNYIDNKISY